MKTKLFTLLFLLVLISACSKKKSITGEEEIVKQEEKETIYTPSESKLSVHDCAFSTATVKWEKATIEDNSEIKYDLYLNDKIVLEDNMETEYSFKELKEKTKYTVKLVAKSKYNTTKEQSISFITTAIPVPKDNELLAKEISLNAITVMWKDDAKSDVKYDLYLNDKKKETDLKASSYTFKELETGTKYTIKLVSKNSYNKTKEIVATFSTKDYPSPTASTLSFKDYRIESVVLCWNHIENEENTYSLLLNGNVLIEDSKENSYLFEGLEEHTKYDFTLVSKNQYGKETESKICLDTDEIINPMNLDFDIISLCDNSAIIKMTNSNVNSNTIKYRIFLNGKDLSGEITMKDNESEINYRLDNLEAETKYDIKVEISNSSPIKMEYHEQLTTLPSKDLQIKITTTSTSIVLDWSTNANIIYPNIIVDNNEQIELRNGEQSYVIEDLESDSEHFITFSASLNTGRTYYRYYKIRTDATK